MGGIYRCSCEHCGHEFLGSDGVGFRSTLLRCGDCGETTDLENDKLFPCYRVFKGCEDLGRDVERIETPSGSELPEAIEAIPDRPQTEPSRLEEHYSDKPDELKADYQTFLQSIEHLAGRCACGGRFDPNAPMRCPQCRSSTVEKSLLGHAD